MYSQFQQFGDHLVIFSFMNNYEFYDISLPLFLLVGYYSGLFPIPYRLCFNLVGFNFCNCINSISLKFIILYHFNKKK